MSCPDVSAILERALKGDANAENQLRDLTQHLDTRIAVCATAALRELQVRQAVGGVLTGVGGVAVQTGTSIDPGSFERFFGFSVRSAVGGVLVVGLLGLLLFGAVIRPRTRGR